MTWGVDSPAQAVWIRHCNVFEIALQSGFKKRGEETQCTRIRAKKLCRYKNAPIRLDRTSAFGLVQERIKGTEEASPIHTLFHR